MRITRHPSLLACLNQGRPPPASPLQLPVENLAQSRCLTGVPGKDLHLKFGMCTTRIAQDSDSDFRARRSLDQFSDFQLNDPRHVAIVGAVWMEGVLPLAVGEGNRTTSVLPRAIAIHFECGIHRIELDFRLIGVANQQTEQHSDRYHAKAYVQGCSHQLSVAQRLTRFWSSTPGGSEVDPAQNGGERRSAYP